MDCPGCASELAENATLCQRCGWRAKSGMSTGMIVLIVLLAVGVAGCGLMSVIAAIAVPNLIEARKHGNEAAAIGALMTISTAESLFREGDKEGDEEFDYGSLRELSDVSLIDGVLGSGTKQGYVFTCEPHPETPEFLWTATASPAVPGTTGDRYFGATQSGVIYYSTTGPVQFDAEGEPLGDAAPVGR